MDIVVLLTTPNDVVVFAFRKYAISWLLSHVLMCGVVVNIFLGNIYNFTPLSI